VRAHITNNAKQKSFYKSLILNLLNPLLTISREC